MATLHAGERQRAWFYPGPNDDADGPYEVSFRKPDGTFTDWETLTADTHPEDGAGFYCWVAKADVPDPEAGDVILATGRNRAYGRYASGRLLDIDPLGVIDVE